MKNEVLSEKYRPKTFSEMVGVDISHIKKFCENPSTMPHFLFHSRAPGTGKTTLAKVIINELKAESLFLNASDERSIDVVRDKIKRFVQCQSTNNAPRIVFLDEADGMRGRGDDTQEALRSLMEQYPAKFILTCNNIDKIIEPIQSRCVKFHLGLPDKEAIYSHLKILCELENINFQDNALLKIIDIKYPSIRDMINEIQLLSADGFEITINKVKKNDEIFVEIYNNIKIGKIKDSRKEWLEKGLNLQDMLYSFFNYIFQDKELGIIKMKELINLVAEADYRMSVGADNDIQMFWFGMKMRDILKNE